MGGGGFLGLGPAPSAPAAPDYSGAAQATAAGNVDAARIATKANRVNQVTPYGSLTYTQNTAPTFNQAGYNAALQSYNQARESYKPVYSQESWDEFSGYTPRSLLNPFDLKAPTYNEFMVAADPDAGWTATQTLSPDQQKLLEYQNQASIGLGRLANTGLGYVEGMLSTPFDTSRLAQMQSSVSPADMQRISGQANLGQVGQAEQLQRVGGGPQALQAGQAQQAFGVNPAEQSLRVGNAQQAQGIGSGEMAQRVGGGPQFQGLETARALRQSGQTEGLQRSLGQNVGMEGWDRASNLLMSRFAGIEPDEHTCQTHAHQLLVQHFHFTFRGNLQNVMEQKASIRIAVHHRHFDEEQHLRATEQGGREVFTIELLLFGRGDFFHLLTLLVKGCVPHGLVLLSLGWLGLAVLAVVTGLGVHIQELVLLGVVQITQLFAAFVLNHERNKLDGENDDGGKDCHSENDVH